MIKRSFDFRVVAHQGKFHPAMFRGHVVAVVVDMILQDHVIKGSCDFMGTSPSWYVTILPSLLALGIVVV